MEHPINQAACKQELSAKHSWDLRLSQRALGKHGQLRVVFPLFVCIYLLSFLAENSGQREMQGQTEKRQNGFRQGKFGLLGNVGWL